MSNDYDIKDIGLAPEGVLRIEWADMHMPVLRAIRERFEKEKPLAGRAHRRLPARHHRDRQPHAHAGRRRRRRGALRQQPAEHAGRRGRRARQRSTACASTPSRARTTTPTTRTSTPASTTARNITMDDGADVIGVLHGERPDMAADIIGGTEETTTGVIRLKALEAEGRAHVPHRRRQRGQHQAHVRQPLRHRPEHARRRHPRHQHPDRRQHRRASPATAGAAAASPCA